MEIPKSCFEFDVFYTLNAFLCGFGSISDFNSCRGLRKPGDAPTMDSVVEQ